MERQEKVDTFSCSVEMHFHEYDIPSALELMRSSIGCTEAKSDCLGCRLLRDTENESRIRYSETWKSDESFRKHARSEEFKRVLIAMDLCCEEPTVSIGNFTGETGLNFLLGMTRP